ncbi:hypothetical protein, partial [Chamaesiphon sp.]|uniref:hypothetical protein n=1 Tax=Chamaesiphon sp. TaxID=2814140 RepID=UPI0035941A39
ALVLARRYVGNDVLMTTTVLLRSGMMGNYHVPFWRAVEGATPSLTLILTVPILHWRSSSSFRVQHQVYHHHLSRDWVGKFASN